MISSKKSKANSDSNVAAGALTPRPGMSRRSFVQSGTLGLLGFGLMPGMPGSLARAAAADAPKALVSVDLARGYVRYNRMLFGQFLEHFHRQVYGGVFEPGSPLADAQGFRTDVITALKELRVPIVRWPGGCFVSAYHWQDGVGRHRAPSYDMAWRVWNPTPSRSSSCWPSFDVKHGHASFAGSGYANGWRSTAGLAFSIALSGLGGLSAND